MTKFIGPVKVETIQQDMKKHSGKIQTESPISWFLRFCKDKS
jgi:hypothetical protein